MLQSSLTDVELSAVIGREEKWLARRIGSLAGPITQQFFVTPGEADADLHLMRPTDAVTVTDGGVLLDPSAFRLLENGTQIERVLGYWWGTTDRTLASVQVTYTPNDLDEVKLVLIDLVRLRIPDPSLSGEQVGQYQYTRATGQMRERLANSLLAQHGAGTTSLRSSNKPDRVGGRGWSTPYQDWP